MWEYSIYKFTNRRMKKYWYYCMHVCISIHRCVLYFSDESNVVPKVYFYVEVPSKKSHHRLIVFQNNCKLHTFRDNF